VALEDGSILVVELHGRRLIRIAPNREKTDIAHFTGSPNGAAMGPDGKCYITNNGGLAFSPFPEGLRPGGQAIDYSGGRIERVDLDTGVVECLYDRVGDHLLRGPNDLVFDRTGNFWFTDSGKGRHRDLDRGGVYYAAADGSEIHEVIYPLLTPNGIGLSQDEKLLYVAETQTGRVWQFDIAAPGRIEPAAWPSPHGGKLLANLGGYNLCDSLAIDGAGNVCVATIMNGGISVVSPDGQRIDQVSLPDTYVTNICFGGEDLRTAYVTLSQTGQLVSMQWPHPGLALNFSRAVS
jgi:gluconolactonase